MALQFAVIKLMSDAQSRLEPKTIIDADDPSLSVPARAKALWENKDIQKATIVSLADSVRVLAALWKSAWDVGKGSRAPKSNIRAYEEKELQAVYRKDKKFVPSLSLQAMAKSGKFEP